VIHVGATVTGFEALAAEVEGMIANAPGEASAMLAKAESAMTRVYDGIQKRAPLLTGEGRDAWYVGPARDDPESVELALYNEGVRGTHYMDTTKMARRMSPGALRVHTSDQDHQDSGPCRRKIESTGKPMDSNPNASWGYIEQGFADAKIEVDLSGGDMELTPAGIDAVFEDRG
jgi:hypothetical protein